MVSPQRQLTRLRERRPLVDHLVRMQEHYGAVKASRQAGAVTYFAFLSFFPVLALAVFVVGWVSEVYPDANRNLVTAINSMLPGLVGNDEDEISLSDVRSFSGLAGLLGLAGVLYSGLGWISALRDALVAVFQTPEREQPGFVAGKLKDLITLPVIGLVLIVAVAVAGFVSRSSAQVLGWLGLGAELGWLVTVIALALGLGANVVLFYTMFQLLARPHVPARALWAGALLGAVGFEVLKQVSTFLIASTKNQPAFQAFGIALVLVVWINYFSRLVLYAASWAYTDPEARAARVADPVDPVQGPATPDLSDLPASAENGGRERPAWLGPFAAGGAAALTAVALLRKKDP